MSARNTLTVAGYHKNLAKIADFIKVIALQANLDDKAVYAIQMAVDEACANIIKHAYGGEGQGNIRLECQIKADGLQVKIFDQGITFDPDQIPKLDPQTPLAERQRDGMGLFFIYNLVDQVDYTFQGAHGNQLTLFKRRNEIP